MLTEVPASETLILTEANENFLNVLLYNQSAIQQMNR